ncbi:MAG: hypothetical protein LWY06_07760 [Firmicutes bacterium]|nr:hypothetical protein [Bacillota bacterium]
MHRDVIKQTNDKGMTLIETIFSLLLLLLMITFISGLFANSTTLEKSDQALVIATSTAESYLEELKTAINTSDAFNNLNSRIYAQVPNDARFIYNVDVRTEAPSLKYVGITVFYEDQAKSGLQPDTKKPNNGRITKIGTFIPKP